jgi:hypothetical protein
VSACSALTKSVLQGRSNAAKCIILIDSSTSYTLPAIFFIFAIEIANLNNMSPTAWANRVSKDFEYNREDVRRATRHFIKQMSK